MVVNGVELNREQKYKIFVSLIAKIDMPTVNKLAAKCSFKRLNPGPVKFDLRYLECKKHVLLEGNYNEDPSGFTPSWDTLKPLI